MNATYVLSGRQFEDVFEKTYQRKVEKMQSVLQCCFEETFDTNASKVAMHPPMRAI